MGDEKITAISGLTDQFSEHFIGHDWPTIIAALALSLWSAMECHAKRCGMPLPLDVKEVLRDLTFASIEAVEIVDASEQRES